MTLINGHEQRQCLPVRRWFYVSNFVADIFKNENKKKTSLKQKVRVILILRTFYFKLVFFVFIFMATVCNRAGHYIFAL